MLKKAKRRFIAWLDWRKYAKANGSMSFFRQVLVLFKLVPCSWFEQGWIKKERDIHRDK